VPANEIRIKLNYTHNKRDDVGVHQSVRECCAAAEAIYAAMQAETI